MNKWFEFLKEHIKIVVPVGAVCVFCAAAVCTVLILDHFNPSDAAGAGTVADTALDDPDKAGEDEADNTISDEENDMPADDGEKEEISSDTDKTPHLFVCVPFDEMHLRVNPGSDPADNIASMSAGEKVIWDGLYGTVNGNVYYHVELPDGTKGYALSDFLVPVYYENDDDVLDIVEISNALYSYEMMESDIERLTGKYKDVLTDRIIGQSIDGRNLHGLFLGNENAKHHIFVQASIHGREYMNTQLVMKLIEYYCHELDSGSINGRTYRELFDDVCICAVPMTNPDGVCIAQRGVDGIEDAGLKDSLQYCYENDVDYLTAAVDEFGDAYWIDHYRDEDYDRSLYPPEYISYEEYLEQWKSNARGIDLNNNFDANWDSLQVKSYPSYSGCKGDYALSEPESSALADLAQEADYDMYISYHSKGEIIYYDTEGNLPGVSEESLKLARLASGQIKYHPRSNITAPNVNQGGFGDWVQLVLNKPSITIESGRHRCPLSAEEFRPMWLRHRELWAVLMDSLVQENGN